MSNNTPVTTPYDMNATYYYSEADQDAYYAEIAEELAWFERALVRAKKQRAAYVAQAAWSDEDCAAVDHIDFIIKDTKKHIKELIDSLDD